MHILVFDITCIQNNHTNQRNILSLFNVSLTLDSFRPLLAFNTRGTALVFTLSGTPGKNFNVFIKIILLRNVDLHSILKSGP